MSFLAASLLPHDTAQCLIFMKSTYLRVLLLSLFVLRAADGPTSQRKSPTPNGVLQFFNRVLQRSHCDPDHPDLPLLLRFLEDDTQRGREERFPEGEALERVETMDQES
jgi:hypothetical protein